MTDVLVTSRRPWTGAWRVAIITTSWNLCAPLLFWRETAPKNLWGHDTPPVSNVTFIWRPSPWNCLRYSLSSQWVLFSLFGPVTGGEGSALIEGSRYFLDPGGTGSAHESIAVFWGASHRRGLRVGLSCSQVSFDFALKLWAKSPSDSKSKYFAVHGQRQVPLDVGMSSPVCTGLQCSCLTNMHCSW